MKIDAHQRLQQKGERWEIEVFDFSCLQELKQEEEEPGQETVKIDLRMLFDKCRQIDEVESGQSDGDGADWNFSGHKKEARYADQQLDDKDEIVGAK